MNYVMKSYVLCIMIMYSVLPKENPSAYLQLSRSVRLYDLNLHCGRKLNAFEKEFGQKGTNRNQRHHG